MPRYFLVAAKMVDITIFAATKKYLGKRLGPVLFLLLLSFGGIVCVRKREVVLPFANNFYISELQILFVVLPLANNFYISELQILFVCCFALC